MNFFVKIVLIFIIICGGVYANDIDLKIGTEQIMLGGRAGLEAGIGEKGKERIFIEAGGYIFIPVSMGKYLELKVAVNKNRSFKIGVQAREGKDISCWYTVANKPYDEYDGNSYHSDYEERILQIGPVIEYSKRDGLLYISLSMLRSVKEEDEFLNGYLDIGIKLF